MKLKPSLDWLLVAVPIAIGLDLAGASPLVVFGASCLAIVPVAGLMGRATEHLAARTGEGLGGILISTFGNAAELIIALAALRAGLHDVVKASIAGSIVGNILLVLGAAMLAGGLRHNEQSYNVAGARSQATLLTLAAMNTERSFSMRGMGSSSQVWPWFFDTSRTPFGVVPGSRTALM